MKLTITNLLLIMLLPLAVFSRYTNILIDDENNLELDLPNKKMIFVK